MTGFSTVWTLICSILKACSAARMAVPDWSPLYRWCCVLLLMPGLPLCALADAHFTVGVVCYCWCQFTVVCCCWWPLYRCGCCWCPLYHCVLLLVFPPPPRPPFTSFLYQHSQSVDVSRTQGSGAPEILFFWGGVRTYVCMHRPPQLLGLPQNNPYWYWVPFKIVAKAISESDVMCRTNCYHFDSFKRCFESGPLIICTDSDSS